MADSKVWYEMMLKKAMSRRFGAEEITENDPLDWERLRILKDGKLVPAMNKGHVGAPTQLDLDVLQDAAEKGNLFLYRMGEVYPSRLIDDAWYSLDPAIADEKRPEEEPMPEAPKMPPPYRSTMAEELKMYGLPADAQRDQLKDPRLQGAYDMAAFTYKRKKEEYEKETQAAYQEQLREYESERAKRTKENTAKIQSWEKRVGVYKNLSMEVKTAIRAEENQRKAEIQQNKEVQRMADRELQGAMEWYNNQFLKNMVRPSKDKELQATGGIDWSRVRIWDGEKYARAIPDGFTGTPGAEALEKVRNAAENGNLFMYQATDKYPSKWVGNAWWSMDKKWIDRLKPTMEEPTKPKLKVPKPEFTHYKTGAGISDRKLAVNKFFSTIGLKFVFRGERKKYNEVLDDYQRRLALHERSLKTYNAEMEKYNAELQKRQSEYDQKQRIYEGMLNQYNTLTPAQKAAMESERPRREEEIKQKREREKQRADKLTEKQQIDQTQVENAEKRIDNLTPRLDPKKFVGGESALSRNVYKGIESNGYDLPANSVITAKDAAVIHVVLAGSAQAMRSQGLPSLDRKPYGQMVDEILRGELSNENLKYLSASYGAGKTYIDAYAAGDPKPLAGALGEGMRNLFKVSRYRLKLDPEMAGVAKVVERILDVLDKDEALLENCGLSKSDMKYARGLAALGKEHNKFMEAQIGLTQEATGAKKHTKEELVTKTVDLLTGKALESHLKDADETTKEKTVTNLGGVEGTTLDTTKNVLKQNQDIQQVATNEQLLKETDLNKRTLEVVTVVQNSNVGLAKDDPLLNNQVMQHVKESLTENSPEAKATKRFLSQAMQKELAMARDVLAKNDPSLATIDLEDQRVNDMHKALKEAKNNLENMRRMKNNGEAEEFALNDPKVVEDAALRSKVRELMAKENETALYKTAINSETVNVRISGLQRAKERLVGENGNLSLTDVRVVLEERTKREADARKFSSEIGDRVQAQDVLNRENGVTVVTKDNWRSTDVGARMKDLKAAREMLGPEYAKLPLNDMKVIQQDYKTRKIDPFKKGGIVDVTKLSAEDRKEYDERMQTIDYLKRQNPNTSYNFRDKVVGDTMLELRAARRRYEHGVQGAKKDLPLSAPAIEAMNVLLNANSRKSFDGKKFKESEIQNVAKEIKDKNAKEMKQIAEHGLQLHNSGKEIGKNIQDWNNTLSARINKQQEELKPTIPGMNH